MRNRFAVAGIVSIALMCSAEPSWAQLSNSETTTARAAPGPFQREAPIRQPPILIGPNKIKTLVDTLKAAKNTEEKAATLQQLEAAIAESFDADMKLRDEQLSKLEERVQNLRALMDRRRKAKAEIIQLEVKVLENEAAGLGFSGLHVGTSWDLGTPARSDFRSGPTTKHVTAPAAMPNATILVAPVTTVKPSSATFERGKE